MSRLANIQDSRSLSPQAAMPCFKPPKTGTGNVPSDATDQEIEKTTKERRWTSTYATQHPSASAASKCMPSIQRINRINTLQQATKNTFITLQGDSHMLWSTLPVRLADGYFKGQKKAITNE